MSGYVCKECGSIGEGGELEYADGTRKHWRNKSAWKDGKVHPILCGGKFVARAKPGGVGEWSGEHSPNTGDAGA